MQYQFKEIPVGSLKFGYIDRGHGESVILIHGSGATDLRTWGQQIEPLADHFRVIAYSRRYHYPNPRIGDGSEINSTYVHADDLAALITSLGLESAHVVGFSYGADIALRFAVQHPDLLRKLVLIEPALFPWLVTLPGGQELFAKYAGKMVPAKKAVRAGELDKGLRLFIESFMGPGAFDKLPKSTHERLTTNLGLLALEGTDISEFNTDISREEAASIHAATLLLTGDESEQMFLLVSQELARILPNAERAEIGHASHLLHVMNPTDFNAKVLEFLGKQTA